MSDPISAILADGWLERYGSQPKQETADELAARLVREARTGALDRALADLRNGREPRQSDLDLFNGEPTMNLRYHDARDEALALHGGDLEWQRDEPDPDDEDGGEQ